VPGTERKDGVVEVLGWSLQLGVLAVAMMIPLCFCQRSIWRADEGPTWQFECIRFHFSNLNFCPTTKPGALRLQRKPLALFYLFEIGKTRAVLAERSIASEEKGICAKP
jgi:hypothetical protein